MKELSIEEKAKRYDKALERAKSVIEQNPLMEYLKKGIEYIFKLNEDERIRKALIRFHKSTIDVYGIKGEDIIAWLEKQGEQKPILDVEIPFGAKDSELQESFYHIPEGFHAEIEGNKVIIKKGEQKPVISYDALREGIGHFGITQYQIDNWLKKYVDVEKQGEQKTADKVESKFKVGDWIVRNGKTLQISHIDKVLDGTFHYWFTVGTWLSSAKMEDAHLWTIQDAKDGDVLSYVTDEEDLWIMIYWSLYEPYEGHVHYHALLVNNNFSDKGTCCICIDDLKPATEEQCELLFQKIKEAGYEWDADKKDLKKIEKKPAEWSEDDQSNFNELSSFILETYRTEDASRLITWLNDIKDRVQLQPKQEWNEDDEKMLSEVILDLKVFRDKDSGEAGKAAYQTEIDWLKSLRPQNWTKEDKERYISCLQRLGTGNPEQPETINSKWFKEHVYSKPQWKPSDEQMKALESIFAKHGAYNDDLISLISDLKKLREK